MGAVASRCLECGWRGEGIHLRCAACGGVTVLEYGEPSLRVERGEASLWRYRGLLPSFSRVVSMGEGLTPLRVVDGVVVKNERKNPTGAYSDRAASLLASYLASSGWGGRVRVEYVEDYAYSVSYYARGLAEVSVVVSDALGADAEELVKIHRLGVGVEFGGAAGPDVPYANPLTFEGLKTILLEIYERGVKAEYVVVPVERGVLAFSLCKALRELAEFGVDPGYTVVGALVEGQSRPWLLDHCRGLVRVEAVEPAEVVKSLFRLDNLGIRTKAISAAAYAVAKGLGRSVAVITIGERRAGRRRGVGRLGSEILELLGRRGGLTAYELWRLLDGYSMRGVYKALKTLEGRGLVCAKYVVRGAGRKVKTYELCGDPAGLPE
ncbi:pyridoxal-5'-phosphate-dependent protein subunit beta [Infirmifilum lucidum]|uniref:Pyridoxal-5'-phosphate-dependent protein subunit beta n=1 Tax=Infirmifilum lucidum TaxID=2776706 RepID=A0A7L9FIN5_9CREN|nr:pyridoxal-phosphate dependent enzyme [Infirmifilum lucidum]QOJ78784.1 pyridoxal-5'-phosphate-dependent protein subunit beta [Infirmifilum lucidum]